MFLISFALKFSVKDLKITTRIQTNSMKRGMMLTALEFALLKWLHICVRITILSLFLVDSVLPIANICKEVKIYVIFFYYVKLDLIMSYFKLFISYFLSRKT